MVNLEHKLTVDDLIVEYMMYKVKNGYEPKFSTSEFISFLYFFEEKMKVEDALYVNYELFKRFFDRKIEHDWSTTNWVTKEKIPNPHMKMEYSNQESDYIIAANYKLSEYDRSVINTYFMDNGMSKYDDHKGTAWKIRNIIGEYLSDQPKRTIDEITEIDENDILIGKYLAAEIMTQIWHSFIDEQIEDQMWPRQCRDINKYLFKIDLSKIIGTKSIKKQLLELYNTFSKRIAILYHYDRNLKVSSSTNSYLAQANYKLLIQGYEKIIGLAFGPYKKTLEFDLSLSTFKESHAMDGLYDWDEEADIKSTTTSIQNEQVKKLVRTIEKESVKKQ